MSGIGQSRYFLLRYARLAAIPLTEKSMAGAARPFGEAEFEINYGKGIDRTAELLELGTKDGIDVVERNGSWYVYGGERLGQGRDRAIEALEAKPELRERIVAELKAKIRGEIEPPVAAAG